MAKILFFFFLFQHPLSPLEKERGKKTWWYEQNETRSHSSSINECNNRLSGLSQTFISQVIFFDLKFNKNKK